MDTKSQDPFLVFFVCSSVRCDDGEVVYVCVCVFVFPRAMERIHAIDFMACFVGYKGQEFITPHRFFFCFVCW